MALDPILPQFQNLDDKQVYKRCYQSLQSLATLNFAIEFDSTNAYAALDLNGYSIKKLLDTPVRLYFKQDQHCTTSEP